MTADIAGKIFALSCAFLWAVSVILFKKSGESITPLGLNIFKSTVSAILFIPVLIIAGTPLVPHGLYYRDFFIITASGILGISISDSLFFKALNMLGAGLTAIVDCFYIPSVLILSYVFLRTPISFLEITGGLLVILAILIASLKVTKGKKSEKKIILGVIYGAMAMFIMGISIILMKPILDRTPIIWVTEVRIFAGVIGLFIFLYFQKNRKEVIDSLTNLKNWKYALPGSILGNFIAMTLWVAAFKLTSVNSAAILNQVNTIFVVIMASLILKEKFTLRRIFATILGFAGSIIILIF